jgi:hypothetical protein
MKWIAIANVTLTILFAIKWGIERARLKGLMFFIVAKEYTPPNEQEMMECIKIVAKKTVEEWIK